MALLLSHRACRYPTLRKHPLKGQQTDSGGYTMPNFIQVGNKSLGWCLGVEGEWSVIGKESILWCLLCSNNHSQSAIQQFFHPFIFIQLMLLTLNVK